ncbi:MAG: cell division protein FtsQ/DivIB [Planctomycetota bacterium]
MAKRKKSKSRTKRISFKLGTSKGKKQLQLPYKPSLTDILKVLVVICILAAVGIAFVLLDKYVKTASPSQTSPIIELIDVPAWVNKPLKEKIYTAAKTTSTDLRLDDKVAKSVQQSIETLVVWLKEVKVQATHDRLLIKAEWRKPLALVKQGLRSLYVDVEMVVLDFVPMPNLPIVKVKGLSIVTKLPRPGDVWQKDDLVAAVAILDRLDRMDKLVVPDKPLLYEIDSIDMSNFNGRRNSRLAHIILYTKGNTEIIWGAEIDTWQQYLEATDEEKLAKLYSYYKEYGSLSSAKYINLRDPQETIPTPIDKY